LFFRNEGETHLAALRAVYRKSGLAVFVTSVTTAVGMLSLLAVPLAPIRIFGFSAALGVLFAFLLTVFMLPVMVGLWPPVGRRTAKGGVANERRRHPIQRLLRRLEPVAHARPWPVIVVFSVATAVLLAGASQLVVDSNLLTMLKKGVPLRTAMETADREMGSGRTLAVTVNAGRVDGLKDPRLLKKMEAFQRYLNTAHPDKVTRTHSLADVAKDSLRALNGGDEAFYRVADDPRLLEQILFLFNNASPKDRRMVVTDDYSMASISVGLRMASTNSYAALLEDTEAALARIFDPLKPVFPELQVSLVGDLPFETRVVSLISRAQVRGFGLALGVISLLLLFLFGSVRVGLLAVLPNLFPMIAVFGLMGFLRIPLDADTMLVVPVTIGIVVDDTIHFLTHYRTELARHGSVSRAIGAAFREAGQAIVFTSLILATSFLALAWMDHQGLSAFGYLGAIAILTALFSDLFFLPALLVAFHGRRRDAGAVPLGEPASGPASA
ncbi:MAG: MMPL family transporter, partial [bacterium]